MDKKIQKVINKCHNLIKKGYSTDYCLNRYKDFQQEIKDYFAIKERISSLKKVITCLLSILVDLPLLLLT